MKTRSFTSILTLALALGFSQFSAQAQLNTGTGPGWEGLNPGRPLLISEKFQGFELFHSDTNPNEGNSDNVLNEETGLPVAGYRDTLVVDVDIAGSSVFKAKYYFGQCAFAPDWGTAYGYRDALAAIDEENVESYQTEGVSKGFVEISREYGASGGNLPTIHGSFIVDLRGIEVEAIQYSHSSTGGNKRGLVVEYSWDDGASWDTLRYQPGNQYTLSFTKDLITMEKTANGYRCDPSAYGMKWEDPLYGESEMMIRFSEAGGQTPRIHDLFVYGDIFGGQSPVKEVQENTIKVISSKGVARLSETANVSVYNLSGVQVKTLQNTSVVSLTDLPRGLYIFKMEARGITETIKVAY